MASYSKIVIDCNLKIIFQRLGCLLAAVALATFVSEAAGKRFYLRKSVSSTNLDLDGLEDDDNLEYTHSEEDEDRIVGGEVADQSWEYFIALIYWRQEDLLNRQAPSCSATVITSQWLLTAAHCIPEDFTEVYVRLGCRNITSL